MSSTADRLYPGQDTLWSPDRTYRYFLRRRVTPDSSLVGKPPIAFVLLNPSTADEQQDDPTVAKTRRYAHAWGYGEVIVLNAFAFRATDPKRMRAHADPVGQENDAVLLESLKAVQALDGEVVCGWGNHGALQARSGRMREILRAALNGVPCSAFPLTKLGEPGHPLYLRSEVARVPFHP